MPKNYVPDEIEKINQKQSDLTELQDDEYEETLPDYSMTPEEANLSKIEPWKFPNWVEPIRDPINVSKYTSHPEYFKDET
eukprot:UN02401